MNEDNPSVMSHVSIGTNDFARSVNFYDRVLSTVGARRVMEHPGAVAYGKLFPEFWVQTPIDGKLAHVGKGLGFDRREQIHQGVVGCEQVGVIGHQA